MSGSPESLDTGAGDKDILAQIPYLNAGKYSDSRLPYLVRFIDSVVKLLKRRELNPESSNDPKNLAIFVLCDRLSERAAKIKASPEDLFANGRMPLCGGLWLTQVTLTSGFKKNLNTQNGGKILSDIENNPLINEFPLVVFDPCATIPEIRYYPKGLQSKEELIIFPYHNVDISLESLDVALNNFYERELKTPDCLPVRVWKNNAKWIPIKEAEKQIQGWLIIFLDAFFNEKIKIRFETPTDLGRADLIIFSKGDIGILIHHAVLELKVLRSFGSTGIKVYSPIIVDAIQKGLRQARDYKKELNPEISMLCCYDMRKENMGDDCFQIINEVAEKEEIELRRWFIYNSSESFRKEKGNNNDS